MKFLWGIFSIVVLLSLQSYGMYAAIYQDGREALDPKRRTHFVVAGIGKELLIKTQEAALTKALYLKKIFPHDQVIFISNFVEPEDSAPWTKLEMIFYSRSHEQHMQQISVRSMIDYMEFFSRIASIQIFSHANIHNGALMSQNYQLGTFVEHFDYIKKLRKHFTDDAYAIMYGCNSGWLLAPKLSESWGIPVAGSFTGSIIERIGHNGIFYDVDAKNVQFPETNLGVPCEGGTCLRMVVQNAPYSGHWGRFEVKALNFFKFFCKGLKNNMERCHRGMAHSILGAVHGHKNLVSNGRVQFLAYRRIVNEFLCSKNWQGSRDNCFNFLNSFNTKTRTFTLPRTSFYMLGGIGQLHSNFEGHNYDITTLDDRQMLELKRKYDFKEKEKIKDVDTLAREFEAYMDAFKYIQGLDFYTF